MTNIPIFLCTDNNFAVPTYITLFSLLENYHGCESLCIYILASSDLSRKNARLFQKLVGKHELRIIKIGDDYRAVSINTPWINTVTMYRLLIPRITKHIGGIDKCIYIDSDTVVEGNILDLFNVDFDGYCIAAVKERYISCDRDERLKEKLGVESLKKYINAGVLLINIKEIEKQGLTDELEEAGYRDDYPHNDQDAINSVFYGRIKILPIRYNALNWYLDDKNEDNLKQYGRVNIREARKKPLIIHYIGRRKPWNCKDIPYAKVWWKYVQMQDDEIIRDYVRPFMKKSKLPLRYTIKETAKKITKKLGIYGTVRCIYKGIRKCIKPCR